MSFLLDDNHVKVHVPAADWAEAIRAAGQVLVNAGSITDQYILNMIQAVKELGPYIVLMPGLALAHAAPCDAVKKTDISLITLERPVDFGSVNGDVSVVLCLACVDRTSHMEKLSEIAEVLMQDGVVDQLGTAEDIDTVIQLLRR